jgi:hypothetical protein
MFEDNPLEPSPFVFDTSDLSTFADLDAFSSRHPSPAIPTIAEPQSDPNNVWFNFSNINDDLFNAKSTTPQSVTGSPWDFLTFSNDSPDSGSTSASGALSPPFAIDPQLMTTPATSKAASDFGDDDAAKDEPSREEEDDEDDDGPVTPPPVRPSSKGKDRKSVVHSGGIQKRVHVSSVVKTDPLDSTLDDWRPTPEEYQKMSSREKRQLRNKISARNFRNRRKGDHLIPLALFPANSDLFIFKQSTSTHLRVTLPNAIDSSMPSAQSLVQQSLRMQHYNKR